MTAELPKSSDQDASSRHNDPNSARSNSPESLPLSSATIAATTFSTITAARNSVSLWGLIALFCASPVLVPLGLVMLPVVLGVVGYGYVVAICLYLSAVQTHNPKTKDSVLPILPLNPYRVYMINVAFVGYVVSMAFGPSAAIAIRWLIKKALSRRTSTRTVQCQDIHYVPSKPDLVLDVHCADLVGESIPLRPVIIFIYGGGWSSGNKYIYMPLAETLQEAGYVVVVPNYTIFPNGKIGDMVFDISHAVHWVHNNIKTYGGDATQIHLMGHSAGAHLCALAVIHDMVSYIETRFPNENLKVPRLSNLPVLDDCLPQIQGLVLLAGVYDINTHFEFESKRCVEEISAMSRVMDYLGSSKEGFNLSSPCVILKRLHNDLLCTGEVARLLPKHWLIVHGDMDNTVPLRESQELHRILKHDVGVPSARLKIYPRVDHVRPVTELMLSDSDYTASFLAELNAHIRDSRESKIELQRDRAGHVVIDGKYRLSDNPEMWTDTTPWMKSGV
ncbi:hypothetical protein HDU67_010301 [Dinochytrium kinnereticum]|nr:hypothetical protein HDU67_010301 [Dinochytrium kinnereticum]